LKVFANDPQQTVLTIVIRSATANVVGTNMNSHYANPDYQMNTEIRSAIGHCNSCQPQNPSHGWAAFRASFSSNQTAAISPVR
jgi:hypothetical protein